MNTKKKGALKRLAAGSIAVVLTASLTACGAPGGQNAAAPAKIYVIGQSKGIQFWDYVEQGAEACAEEFNYDVTYQNAEDITDVNGQIQIVRDAINAQADAIVLAPNDANALNDVLKDAKNAGIQIITIDAEATYDGVSAYVGTINYSGGAVAAREAANLIDNVKDKAAIIGHYANASSAQERVSGFQDVLTSIINGKAQALAAQQAAMQAAMQEEPQDGEGQEGAPPAQEDMPVQGQEGQQGGAPQGEGGQQGGAPQGEGGQQGGAPAVQVEEINPIVSIGFCNNNIDEAKEMTKELLKNKNVNHIRVIFTTNERSTIGVCEAIDEIQGDDDYIDVGEVAVIGFNSNTSELNYLKSGTLSGTVVQNPYNMGYLGVYYAGRLLKGETVPAKVDTGVYFVNKDNLNHNDVQLMLDPENYLKGGNSNG